MTINELANLLRKNGITGAGGAGFPSYAKLNEKADTIILNCAECEPILKLHRQVLEKYAFEIISTLNTIAEAVGATSVIIALKKSYEGATAAATAVVQDFKNTEIKFLPEQYPSGDEVVTIYETTGRVVPPGSIPISVGVIVFNPETILNVYYAIEEDRPVTHKFVTVAGEVKNPKTVYAPIGISNKDLISLAGGATAKDVALISGGPMMGKEVGIYDTVTKTTNAILVLPNDHYIIQRKRGSVQIDTKRAMSSCCQCRMCTDLCPRNLLGHPIEPSEFMHAASSGTIRDVKPMLNTMFCSGCGVCEMYACTQGLSPRKMILEYKDGLRKNGITPPKDVKPGAVSPKRKYRGVSKERLTSRIGLTKYEVDAPLEETEIKIKEYKISLTQHIGAPAVPCVKAKDKVVAGQVIGEAKPNALSANIHTPVSGSVVRVSDKYIVIKQEGEK